MSKPARPLRLFRKWLVSRTTEVSLHYAARLPESAIRLADSALHRVLPRFAPAAPIVADIVRRNMIRAGVYREESVAAYFGQVARHIASALHIFRQVGTTNHGERDSVARLARERIMLDGTLSHLHDAIRVNRGVILAPAHACQFLLGLARLNAEVPLTVYLRYSRHAHGRAAKAAWCRACGLQMIAEASKPADPAARAAMLADALREKKNLVITPDIAQPLDKGIRVRMSGREMSMASGVAALSVLTGAPVVPVMARPVGDRNCFVFHPAIQPPDIPHRRGWRKLALEALQQRWTDIFAAFLHQHPEMWWMWLDNRWTRVFRNDPKYARRHRSPEDARLVSDGARA